MTIPDLERADQIAKSALAEHRAVLANLHTQFDRAKATLQALQDYSNKCVSELIQARKKQSQ